MKTISIFALAGIFASGAFADDAAALRKDYAELMSTLRTKMQVYYEPISKAKSPEEAKQIKLDPAKSPVPEYIGKFKELAKRAGNDPLGLQAWFQVLSLSMGEKLPLNESVEGMLTFKDSDEFANYAGFFKRAGLDEALSKKVSDAISASQSKNVQASVLYTAADELKESDPVAGKKALEVIVQKFPGTRFAEMATSDLFELEFLAVGKMAPDFEAVDGEGKKFKLSDYRGKLVMLDFWGFWCPPCVATLPHNQELTTKLMDKPFALIGVNSDQNGTQAVERIKKEGLTFRNAMVGNTGATIPKQFNVRGWPTVYLIDKNGVIRWKTVGVDPKKLDAEIEKILSEG